MCLFCGWGRISDLDYFFFSALSIFLEFSNWKTVEIILGRHPIPLRHIWETELIYLLAELDMWEIPVNYVFCHLKFAIIIQFSSWLPSTNILIALSRKIISLVSISQNRKIQAQGGGKGRVVNIFLPPEDSKPFFSLLLEYTQTEHVWRPHCFIPMLYRN